MLYIITSILTKTFTFKQIIQLLITFIILIILIKSYKSYLIKSNQIKLINQLQLQKSLKFQTILIFTSSLSSLSLFLIQSLSKTKDTQIIIILPTSNPKPKEIELIDLLRESNPHLFLERCDLSNQNEVIKFIQTLIKTLQTPINSDPLKNQITFKLHSIIFFYNHHHNSSLKKDIKEYQLEMITSPLLILQILLPFLTKSNQSLPIKIIPIYPPINNTNEFDSINSKSKSILTSFQSSLTNPTNAQIPIHILPTQIPSNQSDLIQTFNSFSSNPASLIHLLKFLLIYPLLPTSKEVINDLLYMIVTPIQLLPIGKVYENQRPVPSTANPNDVKKLLLNELDQNSNLIKSLLKSN